MPAASVGMHLDNQLQAIFYTGIRYVWVGDESPHRPKEGDVWFDTSTRTLKMYRP